MGLAAEADRGVGMEKAGMGAKRGQAPSAEVIDVTTRFLSSFAGEDSSSEHL